MNKSVLLVSGTVHNIVRSLSVTSHCYAGLQGFQGTRMNPEQRQRMMDRKMKLIRKWERVDLELKPIPDFFIPLSWKESSRHRQVDISEDENNRRAVLNKKWQRHKAKQNFIEREALKDLKESQAKALKELRIVSEELYEKAMTPDTSLLSFSMYGPLETPPITNYTTPLGCIVNFNKEL